MRPTPHHPPVLGAVLCAMLGAALAACGTKPETPAVPAALPVTIAAVTERDVPLRSVYPGIVYSPRNIQLNARVEGFLQPQVIADGSIVKTGDVVYKIDPRSFEAAVLGAQGKLAQAIAERDYAAIDKQRNEELVKVNAISQLSFDQILSKLAAAEGEVLTAQADLATAKINLGYCTIAAPFPGMLGASEQFEGDVVGQATSTKLNSLVQLDPLWVQFSPSSTEWPQYRELMAKGPVKVQITYDGAATLKATGTLIFADNQVATSTSTLMLRAQFPNTDGTFRPGTYAEVEVVIGTLAKALTVPEEAVFAREADLYVWRVKPDNTVESVQVEPIRADGNMLAITGKIAAGDRIVVDGIQRMRPGALVHDTASKGTTPAAAAQPPAPTPTH